MARILYVEDNGDNIYMLKHQFEPRDFKVLVARDGQTGVEAAREHLPDLILLDLKVLDGWELGRYGQPCRPPLQAWRGTGGLPERGSQEPRRGRTRDDPLSSLPLKGKGELPVFRCLGEAVPP